MYIKSGYLFKNWLTINLIEENWGVHLVDIHDIYQFICTYMQTKLSTFTPYLHRMIFSFSRFTIGTNFFVSFLITDFSLTKVPLFQPMHRSAFCQLPFPWIYYWYSTKSTGKESGKMQLCAMVGRPIHSNFLRYHLYFRINFTRYL